MIVVNARFFFPPKPYAQDFFPSLCMNVILIFWYFDILLSD
jgi:hypothetical protein